MCFQVKHLGTLEHYVKIWKILRMRNEFVGRLAGGRAHTQPSSLLAAGKLITERNTTQCDGLQDVESEVAPSSSQHGRSG